MEDRQILELYWARREEAISRTEEKYGAYCGTIARNILQNEQDAEECLNDAWLSAWNSIPPKRPENLAAFLGKLTRCRAIDRWRALHTEKRGSDCVTLALEELEEVLPAKGDPEQSLLSRELAQTINGFLSELGSTERNLFLCRYWYFDSVAELAENFHFSRSKVKSTLFRTRGKLRSYLQKEGLL